jgi:copper chaperone CopZ
MKEKNRDTHKSDISATEDAGPGQAVPASGMFVDSCCGIAKESQRRNAHEPGTSEGPGTYEHVSFPIGGMSCQSCAGRIEEALSGCPGVIKAVVDFQRREAGVRFDPAKVNLDVLRGIVEKTGYRIPEKRTGHFEEEGNRSGSFSHLSPYLIGAAAALGVVGFYLGLLTLTSDWHNALHEFREYSLWILALAAGLGLQATLFLHFRAWHGGGSMKGAKCSLATSGGMSTAAMAACCSHYLLLVFPALGLPFLSSAAAGLANYQTYFFLAGILSNLFGIGYMLRLMIRSGMIRIEALEGRMIFGAGHIKQ